MGREHCSTDCAAERDLNANVRAHVRTCGGKLSLGPTPYLGPRRVDTRLDTGYWERVDIVQACIGRVGARRGTSSRAARELATIGINRRRCCITRACEMLGGRAKSWR